MKICVAQTRPFRGDIRKNIDSHIRLINIAVSYNTGLIVFPELSLTGYEPGLAEVLATNHQDTIFDPLQQISDNSKITICVGMPTKTGSGILISMSFFNRMNQGKFIRNNNYIKTSCPISSTVQNNFI